MSHYIKTDRILPAPQRLSVLCGCVEKSTGSGCLKLNDSTLIIHGELPEPELWLV
jgi:hypothetical protein